MDEDAARRRRAVLIAGHEGDIATVRAHIDDAKPGVRSAVVSSLHRLGAVRARRPRPGARRCRRLGAAPRSR
ncbi:MAG: hypothetical protein R2701_10275 [Acidimicrobiales bacterium]